MRKLQPSERDFIVEYITEGIQKGETDAQLKERRKELRHVLEGVTPEQINAVSAWIKIRSKHILGTPQGGPDARERPPENTDASPIGAEHFNYDNERKERWRRKWEEFIDANTAATERTNMKVLCLPGKMCLEIPLYLRLGFQPENITGVEGGDADARDTFRSNASSYGIRGIEGRMEEFLKNDTTAYDVVSLDFPGQLSFASSRIAQKILLAPRALVLTNFMAKREQSVTQQGLVRAQELMRLSNEDFKAHGVYALDTAHQKAHDRARTDTFDLAQARTFSGLSFHSNFGYLRKEHRMCAELFEKFPIPDAVRDRDDSFSKQYSQQDWETILKRETLEISIQIFLETLERTLCGSGMPQQAARNLTFMLQALGRRGYFGTPFTMDLKSYRYISGSDNGASPFESDFAVLHTPVREYRETRHTLSFLISGASSIMKSLIDQAPPGKMYIRDKRQRPLDEGERVSTTDTVCFDDGNNQSVCSIRMNKLFCDLRRYGDIYENSVTESLDKNALVVPRETIE